MNTGTLTPLAPKALTIFGRRLSLAEIRALPVEELIVLRDRLSASVDELAGESEYSIILLLTVHNLIAITILERTIQVDTTDGQGRSG